MSRVRGKSLSKFQLGSAGLLLLAAGLAGCSGSGRGSREPLTAGECKQMKEKQLSMILAELPAEYRNNVDRESMTLKEGYLQECEALKDMARPQFECTMSSGSMPEMERCVAGKVAGN